MAPAFANTADLVLLHGRIYTLDATHPWAQAIAIAGGRVIAVGSDAKISARYSKSARTTDLRGRLVTPKPRILTIARFGTLGVIASMQPLMIYPRDEWKGMEGLWQRFAGDRFMGQAFAIQSLLDAHARVAFGTDWPVVQLNLLLGLRNAVRRQSMDGQPAGGYVASQRITLAEALPGRPHRLFTEFPRGTERRHRPQPCGDDHGQR